MDTKSDECVRPVHALLCARRSLPFRPRAPSFPSAATLYGVVGRKGGCRHALFTGGGQGGKKRRWATAHAVAHRRYCLIKKFERIETSQPLHSFFTKH